MGNTVAPHISSDDYHFGESLLGWWSYLQGVVPYVGYVPAHGLIDDDLNRFLSSIFYDGSAGSVVEAGRLGFTVLAFAAFLSIYYFSGSIGLAFVAVFFLGSRLTWFFLTPFLCLWFSRNLINSPSRWLTVWILTAPIVILGVPPQGLLLVAASGVMAAYFCWQIWRHPEDEEMDGGRCISCRAHNSGVRNPSGGNVAGGGPLCLGEWPGEPGCLWHALGFKLEHWSEVGVGI